MHFSKLFFALVAGSVLAGSLLQAQTNRDNDFFFGPQLHASGSYLGVSLADIDADRANALKLGEAKGVEVTQVWEGSPAEKAGIRAGDVLLSYNGENILGAQQFVRLVQETPQGRKIKVQFWRDGRMQSAAVITGAPEFHRVQPLELPNGSLAGLEGQIRELQTSIPLEIPSPLLAWKSSVLGIECEPVDSQLAQYFGVKQGVLVRSVEKGSAAEKAGLKAGDVVTAVGERSVASPRDVSSFLRTQHKPGESVTVALVRDHKALSVSVVPSDGRE
ncbi:MAG: PDZ domain-containing protein [Bryobacteraceae bacterium]